MHPAGWTWARINSIFTQRMASLPFYAATGSGEVSDLTWPQSRYWHAQKWFLLDSHEGAKLQRTPWLSGRVPCCIPQLKSPMAARLSLLSSIVRHVTTKTWDQPNRQIWVSSCGTSTLIYWCIGFIIAILIHCLLALLTFLTNHLTSAWVDVQ